MRRYLLITAGFACLSVGVVGIFLPLLPTTPLLLLAAGCFFRSSERFYSWMTNHRVFGSYVKNYLKYRAVSLKSKIFTLILLWGVIIISICLFPKLWLRILLACVAVGVSIHILMMRRLTDEMLNADDEEVLE